MSSFADLAPRLECLQDSGLTVKAEYKGNPAQWLTTALDSADVLAINAKGVKVNDTVCLVRLSTLERLVQGDVKPTPATHVK